MTPKTIAERTFTNPWAGAEYSRTEEWRRAEIPAAGGTGNARSVATIQSLIACGGEAFGKRLLSEAGARRVLEEQTSGVDHVFGVPIRNGLGYSLSNETMPLAGEQCAFWGGWGGSTILVDLERRLSLSYVMNRMEPGILGDPRGTQLRDAVYASIEEA